MSELRATLRLQFHRDFTLDDAVPLVDYFAGLGISHLYASPLLTARPGSLHGYDVIDPTRINPELGGEPALRRLVEALRSHGMGLLLDIVSNHMAVGGAGNPWWLDVLEWGRRSPYAGFFDIQWNSPDPLLEGQLLVPFLRSDYGEVLQAGEIPLQFDAQTGSFHASHYEHRFPISPPSYGELLRATGHPALQDLALQFDALAGEDGYLQATAPKARLAQLASQPEVRAAIEAMLGVYDSRRPEGLERLHVLLEHQFYRLASWRTAADDINWRRFFDINELGGLRVERPRVFEATHAKIFELLEEGLIDGLRIDHIDGLADPRGYCRRLRRRLDRLDHGRQRHRPIYVEKILAQGEELHGDWQVDGTTGYEFMNQLSLLQHDPDGETPLRALWHSLSGRPAEFLEEVRQARQLVLTGTLAGDFESAAQALLQVARSNLMTRDLTFGQIRRALLELISHFPVYRTYIGACGRPAQDEPFFRQALEGARTTLNEAEWPLLAHLDRWLGGEPLRSLPPGVLRKVRRHACVRFQQVTAPAAAKAVEDTAFYRSGMLLSRNDVGFDSQRFSAPPEDFHAACLRRRERFPDSLLASATHDHKRGEDTRTRLAVLSERAGWYAERVQRWLLLAQPLRRSHGDGPAPAPADELMLYQTLLGSWPLGLAPDDDEGLRAYAGRLRQWQEKALREAKLYSSWSAPNAPYEEACRSFLDDLLEKPAGARLREEIAASAASIAPAGALNSLAQTLLRMTVPGVPDLYQGAEFWDFSLVDPDNRRPVDFTARRQALAQGTEPAGLLEDWRDGRIKQALIAHTLALRARYPALFAAGDYLPLEVAGEHSVRLLAFARHHAGQWAVVLVPRLASGLLGEDGQPLIEAAQWSDTRVLLPATPALRGLFSGDAVPDRKGELFVREALATFPVGLFHGA
ncbi:malto-oligosyltrehalose synthase [Azotobacter salinestris]|uniref:malto-oligosyltrehalose synthase n=1 Tax=Azotobacter salinestris TaxID=69964 RepID=UPI0012669BA2|nr:malto-oligosyltrehalose synthase [Azotobacter salinestris]